MNLQPINSEQEHAPTPEQRRLVESTSGVGLPYNEIAALVGIDEATLLQHYAREIELGQAKASGQIAKAIYNKALDGDTASLKLWTQTQEKAKRKRGRPKGAVKTPMHRKLCMDRMLPVSMFEKEKNNRSAVTINITGIGEAPTIIEAQDITDV